MLLVIVFVVLLICSDFTFSSLSCNSDYLHFPSFEGLDSDELTAPKYVCSDPDMLLGDHLRGFQMKDYKDEFYTPKKYLEKISDGEFAKDDSTSTASESGRYLYPYPQTITISFSIQVPGLDILGLPTTYFFKPIFYVFVPRVVTTENTNARDGRALNRNNRTQVFNDIENFIESVGYDGKSCLLRSICELGALPFDHGLLGEIINFLFLLTKDEEDNEIYSEYSKARKMAHGHGVGTENCADEFPKCSISLLDLVSDIQFV